MKLKLIPDKQKGEVTLIALGAVTATTFVALGIAGYAYSKNSESSVQTIIDAVKKNSGTTPDRIFEYEYKGQKVYLAEMPCCDHFNPLFSAKGEALCAPTGGFAGNGDGKCPDFEKEKKGGKLLWEKGAL